MLLLKLKYKLFQAQKALRNCKNKKQTLKIQIDNVKLDRIFLSEAEAQSRIVLSEKQRLDAFNEVFELDEDQGVKTMQKAKTYFKQKQAEYEQAFNRLVEIARPIEIEATHIEALDQAQKIIDSMPQE